MARLNYTLLDKYLLTLTSRIDGSSRLAEGNKYATFPSVALGWRVIDENAEPEVRSAQQPQAARLVRHDRQHVGGSVPDAGRPGRTVYSYGSAAAPSAISPGTLPNPKLQWEKTATCDGGADFGLLDGRLTGTVDYYRANTNDLLMDRQLPPSTGYSVITQNVGSTRNTGLELALTAITLDGWHGIHWTNDITFVEEQERDRRR